MTSTTAVTIFEGMRFRHVSDHTLYRVTGILLGMVYFRRDDGSGDVRRCPVEEFYRQAAAPAAGENP